MKRMPTRTITAVGIFAVAAVAVTLTSVSTSSGDGDLANTPAIAKGATVVLGHGRDRTASRTASDWVTYADHVAVVTVVKEAERAPNKKEIERGEGMIGRTITERIDKVLWSAPDAPQPPPNSLDLSVPGWVFNNNDGPGKRKFALEDSPRIDVGHTYIRAIEWIDDPCSDDAAKGKWDSLGSGSVIPFDQGVIGQGEFEGKSRSVEEAKTKRKGIDPQLWTLRDKMIGGDANALVNDLKAAKLRPEKNSEPRECNPQDR